MKNKLLCTTTFGLFLFSTTFTYSQNIGINTTGGTPNGHALLDLTTGNTSFNTANGDKGVLIPQISLATTTDVANFATGTYGALPTGLLVYNTNAGMTGGWVGYWNWNGTKWVALLNSTGTGAGWNVTGNAGTTAGTNFLGTTDATDMVFKTNSAENMRIANSTGFVGIGTTLPLLPLHVFSNANTAPLYLKAVTGYDAFSILPWNGETFLCAGTYFLNGAWVQASSNTSNALIAIQPNAGVLWYNSNNNLPSWNVASGATQWDVNGYWKNLVQSTATGVSYFTGGNVGIETTTPHGAFDVFNPNANGDGAVFAPDITLDNNFTIQTYIDNNIGGGGWAGRTTYAGGCCNNLALQPDVGTVSIGGTSGNYGSTKLTVTGGGIGGTYGLLPNYTSWAAYGTGDGGAAIYNDAGGFKALMIVGNTSAGGSRQVALWDYLTINGKLKINDGTQAAGNILTSDAAGQASWVAPTSILVYGNNAKSVKLTSMVTDNTTGSYLPIPGATITMTTVHNTFYVFASITSRLDQGSGVAAQFGQAIMEIEVVVDGVVQTYAGAVITDWDYSGAPYGDGIVTTGTVAITGVPVTLTPGSHTIALYWEPTILWATSPWTMCMNPASGAADQCILTVFD